MDKCLLIDGNSIMNRAFYGVMNGKMLANKDGVYTNAIYGFLNIFSKVKEDINPEYIAVSFDLRAPTFRHEMFENYKAHRKGMPDELRVQMPIIKDVLRAMNIPIYEKEGYEADDILGTIAVINEKHNIKTYILSGDKDELQLINENINIILPTQKPGKTEYIVYDYNTFFEKYGIKPNEYIDVKALMGDPSDNIPGVKGVGEKTAFDLIKSYKNIEYIYDNIDSVEIKDRTRQLLKDDKEMAFTSKTLATIHTTVPVDFKVEKCLLEDVNKEKLLELFKYLEFNKLIDKFKLNDENSSNINNIGNGDKEYNLNINYLYIEKNLKLEVEDDILSQDKIAYVFDKEYRNIFIYSSKRDKAYCLSLNKGENIVNIEFVKKIFESDKEKIGYSTKNDMKYLLNNNIQFANISYDLEIAYYLLDSSKDKYDIEYIAKDLFKVDSLKKDGEENIEKNKQISMFDMVDNKKDLEKNLDDNELDYYSKISKVIYLSNEIVIEKLRETEQFNLYNEIEIPLVEVLASMESYGVKIDKQLLEKTGKELEIKLTDLTKKIYEISVQEFNINSTQQLGKVLFEDLKLPVIKKTKNGYSTDKEVLDELEDKHEIIKFILEYRQIMKLKSTYIDGLVPLLDEEQRVHTTFNQTVTSTGRLSSTEPNIQNIPIKTEEGKKLRKLFVADEGMVFVDADYSQIELRILAHVAQDKNMIYAFTNNEDIHKSTAANVFDVDIDSVTKEMRSAAKAVNFGIVYGISDFGLAKNIGCSRKEAQKYIQEYLEDYASVKDYMDNTVTFAKENGYVTTMFGRKRSTPEINSNNGMIRKFGERIAINSPIQGAAADIIKLAMIKIYRQIKKNKLKSKLILQVHDELIIETKEEEVQKVIEIMKECMQEVIELSVPLKIDIGQGKDWYEAKE